MHKICTRYAQIHAQDIHKYMHFKMGYAANGERMYMSVFVHICMYMIREVHMCTYVLIYVCI
jgi:hypothetical protein